jgi:hypothetical protein
MVVHAAEAAVAWSVGSDSEGRSSTRRLPWRPRRRLCPRVRVQQRGKERLSGLGTSFGSPHHERGDLGMGPGGGARCGHERHALVHASPLEQKHEQLASVRVDRLELQFGPDLGRSRSWT